MVSQKLTSGWDFRGDTHTRDTGEELPVDYVARMFEESSPQFVVLGGPCMVVGSRRAL